MSVSKQQLVQVIEEVAPQKIAEEWDNVGLQVGSLDGRVTSLLLTLDVTADSVRKARDLGCELIISHHPVIFRPLKSLQTNLPQGRLLAELLQAGITVYTAHTNWDNARFGTSWQLAKGLGLENSEILKVVGKSVDYKLTVYVPEAYAEPVFLAMAEAGGGRIGNYSHCSFRLAGTGTYRALPGAQPFVGEVGELSRVVEVSVEMAVEESKLKAVLTAMTKAHPYEEVAYDVLALHNGGHSYGLGRIGLLPAPQSWVAFFESVAAAFPLARHFGERPDRVRKIAVCGGSGGSLVSLAASRGADVLITGDVGHHHALDAESLGLALIDAGHAATEALILPAWQRLLMEKASSLKADLRIHI